jgi:RND family efflux transporter MFP subunit
MACASRRRVSGFALAGLLFGGPALALELEVRPVDVPDTKAVYGRVESRFVIPARTRLGGTLVELSVSEGSAVAAGQIIARVVDEKLALQVAAADARIRAVSSELANARTDYERVQSLLARGATTQQRVDQLRTQVEVLVNQVAQAGAERAVILQQSTEGDVLSPAAGRVLTVPARRGGVMLPGEMAATVAGGGVFLRLAIPERHAAALAVGAVVEVGEREAGGASIRRTGRIEKVYPQIDSGRVVADVEVAGLPDTFVGERILVRVPVARRTVIAVPSEAIVARAGLDFVRIADGGATREVVVILGEWVETAEGRRREILTGLAAGDRIVAP